MISIIIPIYNAEKWLNECLQSISQQSHEDFEVLMVDDGSKDGSADICKEYAKKDSRFHYLYQNNAGVSVARNTGLSNARGEWISFVDSDDMIDKHFLREMLTYTEHADAVWCGFSTKPVGLGERGKISTFTKEKLIKNIIFERGKKPQLWSLYYKREIIEINKLRFTPGCVRNEDYEFFMKYLSLCERPIICNGYVGYYYRQNPESVMHKRRSLQSVLMSIEASSNVGEAVERLGVIPNRIWLTAFSVTRFLFIVSRDKNLDAYNVLHERYSVLDYVVRSIKSGGIRVKCVAFMYIILGRDIFYKFFSFR